MSITLVILVLKTPQTIHNVRQRKTIGGKGKNGSLIGRFISGLRTRKIITPKTATPVVKITTVPTDSKSSLNPVDQIKTKLRELINNKA